MVGLKRLARSESGFTVVELVVAAAILFVVSTGIMGVLAYASTSNASDAKHQMGLELANQRMEQARNMNYDDLGTTNNYPTGTIVTPETVVLSTPAGNSTYIVETEVDYSEDVTDPSLGASKDIRITVSWTTPRPGSVTVESNIAGAPAVTNAGAVEILVQDSDTSDPVPGAVITIKPAGGFSASKTTGLRWLRQVEAGRDRIHHHHGHLRNALPRHEPCCDRRHQQQGDSLGDRSGRTREQWHGPRRRPERQRPSGRGSDDQGSLGLRHLELSDCGRQGPLVSDANGNVVFPLLRKGNHTVTGVLAGYAVQASPSPDFSVISGGGAYSSVLTMEHTDNHQGQGCSIAATIRFWVRRSQRPAQVPSPSPR